VGKSYDQYYSGDQRGSDACRAASRAINSTDMATRHCPHRSQRDDRLDVSPSLWICQTSLSADLVDPAPGQMVSLAKSAKRPQGSTAIKPVELPVRRTTCPAPILAATYLADPRFYPARNAAAADRFGVPRSAIELFVPDKLNDHVLAPRAFKRAPVVIRTAGFRFN
jgi:hypothetical protein